MNHGCGPGLGSDDGEAMLWVRGTAPGQANARQVCLPASSDSGVPPTPQWVPGSWVMVTQMRLGSLLEAAA